MKRITPQRSLIGLLVSLGVLTIIFTTTQPDQIPAIGLVAVFLLVYIVFVSLTMILIRVIRSVGDSSWRDRAIQRIALAIAIIPTFLLVLQSIGQLTVQDVLLTFAFGGIAYFYYRRFFSRESKTE